MKKNYRYIMLGTGGSFTRQVLKYLIRQGQPPSAYIQWRAVQAAKAENFQEIALEINRAPSAIDVMLEQQRITHQPAKKGLHEQIAHLAADFLLVACWPERLNQSVLQAVKLAALNLHPSLLPKYRGIDPIAEQLSNGEKKTGVTLHLLNQHFDQGDIVLQKRLPLGTKATRGSIEQASAKIGAELFIEALKSYDEPGWKLTPQP